MCVLRVAGCVCVCVCVWALCVRLCVVCWVQFPLSRGASRGTPAQCTTPTVPRPRTSPPCSTCKSTRASRPPRPWTPSPCPPPPPARAPAVGCEEGTLLLNNLPTTTTTLDGPQGAALGVLEVGPGLTLLRPGLPREDWVRGVVVVVVSPTQGTSDPRRPRVPVAGVV